MNLTTDHTLIRADLDSLPSTSYSYISANNSAGCSWIDHVVCSDSTIVANCDIMYGETLQDHIPLGFELYLPDTPQFADFSSNLENNFNIIWVNVTEDQLDVYSDTLDGLSVELWVEALSCSREHCDKEAHLAQLDHIYQSILESIRIATDHLPRMKQRHHKRIVGWNQYCKHLYARGKFFIWHGNSKPHHGEN